MRVLTKSKKGEIMELSERRKKILCRAVEEFIKDSSPITSGGIKDLAELDCSTATLRNELNTLEALGFLKQLHTSGGRVPTPQGYRFYVEELLRGVKATDTELEDVQKLISSRTKSLSELVTGIAKIVSHATNYPTVVMMNNMNDLLLTEFKIIPLLDNQVMVLVGTIAGYITNTLDIQASQIECNDASTYLTKNFKGCTIGEMVENIEALEYGMHDEIKAFQTIVDSLLGGLKRLNSQKLIDVRSESAVKLIENSKTIDEAKNVMSMLDDKEKLADELTLSGNEIEVTVAEEKEGSVASVVKAPIVVGGRQLASIGVIGPQRMDYNKIASALKVVVDSLSGLKGDE